MHSEFSHMPDERAPKLQGRLFDRLEQAGFTTRNLMDYCHVPRTTAYRIAGGESALPYSVLKELLERHPSPRIAQAVLYELADQAPVQVVVLDDSATGPVDSEIADVLRQVADLIQLRGEHKSDGIITPQERDEELRQLHRAADMIHRAIASTASQQVGVRRKARPLSLTGSDK